MANGTSSQSKKYVGSVSGIDKESASITIPSQYLDYSGSNYFVATYTSSFNGATSPFSAYIEIKDLLCSSKLENNLFGTGVTEICPGEKIDNYIEIPKLKVSLTWKKDEKDMVGSDVKIETDSRGQKYTIDKAGIYNLKAIVDNNTSCTRNIEFKVSYKAEPAVPNFIVKSHVYVGDTIAVVDLDYKDNTRKVEWLHEGVTQITKDIYGKDIYGKDVTDIESRKTIYLSYPNTGTATISQTSIMGPEGKECAITVKKEITIVPQPTEKKDKGKVGAEVTRLLDASVFPNPISGNANLIVSMRTKNKSPFTVSLYRIVDAQPLQRYYYKDDVLVAIPNTDKEFQFEHVIDGWQHLAKGVYYLKVDFNNDSKVIKFVTN